MEGVSAIAGSGASASSLDRSERTSYTPTEINEHLVKYADRPLPEYLVTVHTRVFDAVNKDEQQNFEKMLLHFAEQQVTKLVSYLRSVSSCSIAAAGNRLVSDVCKVRNYLYCLQSGFRKVYIKPNVMYESSEHAIKYTMQQAGVSALFLEFWEHLRDVVEAEEFRDGAVLVKLVHVCSRCESSASSTSPSVLPLRVPLQSLSVGATSVLKALLRRLMSPTRSLSSGCNEPSKLVLNAQRKLLVNTIVDYLGSDDFLNAFGVNRTSRTLVKSLMLLSPVESGV